MGRIITAQRFNGGILYYVTGTDGRVRRCLPQWVGRRIVTAFRVAFAMRRSAEELRCERGVVVA